MKKTNILLKEHLYCTLFSRGIRGSFGIAVILILWQILANYTPIVTGDPYPSSVFSKWIGGEFHTLAGQLFYILLPLLCALPFQSRFFLDKRDGYLKSLLLRISRREIFVSYYLANFIVSFIITACAFLLNLLVSSMLYPALRPQPLLNFLPSNQNALMVDLFFEYPWIYCLIYIIMISLFMAALSNVGLAFGQYMKNAFFVIVSPFMGYFIFVFALEQLGLSAYSPLYFLQPTQINYASWSTYFAYLLGMLGVSFFVFRNQVDTCEIL